MGFRFIRRAMQAWMVAAICFAAPAPSGWLHQRFDDESTSSPTASPPTAATVAWGQSPKRARASSPRLVSRVLNGRSEPRRLQLIQQLASDSRFQREAVEEIVAASESYLERAAEIDSLPPSAAELLRLLGRIEHPATERLLVELLQHERLDIAMITADALGEFRRFDAIEPLTEQTEHPAYPEHYGFRFNLVRALLRMRHPDAIEFLGTLETTLDGQLRHELGKHLDEVTSDQFRGDNERFDAWRRETGRAAESAPLKLASQSGSNERMELAKSSYYGVPIHAQRLVFVIDISGSMNKSTYGGTRLSHAKRELVKTIRALPDDAEFTIIAYNELVLPWRADLVPAVEENKASALRYVAGLRTNKSTDTYAALRETFRLDSNLEAVFLLSDGRPNRGEITVPAAIVQDISRRNRRHNLLINTVGISVSGPTQEFMERLAETNAGTFRAVD